MRIYIILYHHKHGHDVFFAAAESEDEAIKRQRAKLVEQYSEEEIADEEEEYGGLEVAMSIVDGEVFECNGARYRVLFEQFEQFEESLT